MKLLTSTMLLVLAALPASAQQLAFPEAQGWGRFATGGRTGTVYHVTNLNDSGAGSLRDAASQPNRIIVFDVAGVIKLSSRLVFSKNLYIAGQTAPGEGVTVYGNAVSFSGATNTICRYMRFRMGAGGDSGRDCAGVSNGTNMIFDHCSFAWGRDETFSINSDGKGDLGDITIMNCIVGQGLMSHSAGGLIQADNITLYRNFYCDNNTRNNKVKGRNQYANNIVYNWKDGAYIMGGDSEGQSYCNIQGNLFINGPCGDGNGFSGGNGNFHCYVKDNMQDKDRDGQLNPAAITNFAGSDVVATPYAYPPLDISPASSVLSQLSETGASYPFRDYVDCYMVDEVMTFGKEGAFISNEGSLPYGIPSVWKVWKGEQPVDTDKDGIPDTWEAIIGSDPAKDDAMVIGESGYANIELYLNSLPTAHNDLAFLRQPMLVSLQSSTTTTMQITWRDWTEREDGFAVETKTEGGDFAEVARTEPNATSVRLAGLEPGLAYTVRIRAFGKNDADEMVYSDYSDEAVFKTRPLETGVVDIDSYEADAAWTAGEGAWDKGSQVWNTSDGLYADGMKVLFADAAQVTVGEDVMPACVVVNSDEDVTLKAGGGVLAGATSVNKGGAGRFTMDGAHSYTGATVLHEGTYSFSSLKNSGEPSGLGASEEFSQNWIFDGGTYEYTGTSTATNRSAKLLRDSRLSITNSAATVTMNGTFEGGGSLSIAGKGTLQAAGAAFFTYTGSTILEGGTLYLPTADISNKGIGASSRLVFAGGTLKTKGESEGYETYAFPMEVKEGTKSVFAPNRNCYMKSAVTGGGTLQLDIPYVREYVQGNWDGFTGTLIANALNKGNLFLLNGKNIPNAVVVLKGGVQACGWDTEGNYTLGGLSGDAGTYLCGSSKKTDGFKCAWTIGGANTDETFRGIINNWSCSGSGHVGTVSITKTGTGVWRLTGANEYSGTTTVKGGTLTVNGAHTGKGAVTVNAGATLAGTGSLAAPVTIKAGATIHSGDTLVLGHSALTLKGKLTVQSGGTISIPVSVADPSAVKTNHLVLSGGASLAKANIELDIQDATSALNLPVGTELKIFSPASTVTGTFGTITPATPGTDKVWDTTDLLKKGILRVAEDPSVGIGAVSADNPSSTAYDLSGKPSNGSKASRSIYIYNNKKVVR